MKLWVNRGLVNGREYSYIVKAIDAKGKVGPPSKENSDFVDPTAPPWDSRDAKRIILFILKDHNRANRGEMAIKPHESFTVMGPDGRIYERLSNGRYNARKPEKPDFAVPTVG